MHEKRPSALMICPEPPYPLCGGGRHRTACVLEYLCRRYEVDLVLFGQAEDPDPTAWLPPGSVRRVKTLKLRRHSKQAAARAARNALRLLRRVPPLNDRFSGFEREIAEFVSGQSYQAGVVEHFWCAHYWPWIAPCCERTVLDLHNIESVLLQRMAGTSAGVKAWMLHRLARAASVWERRWLPKFDLLLAASAADARRAEEAAAGAAVRVMPNTLPWIPRPEPAEEDAVAFSGNFDYEPNAAAAAWFAQEVWPRLSRERRELEWRLIGRCAERLRPLSRTGTGIRLVGAVEDAVRELARAKVVVVPVRAGSGTRVKILEAWAAARPVVSTTLGAEGLEGRNGQEVLLADQAEEFARAVGRLLDSEALRRQAGDAGRILYERRYTREAGWRALEEAGL